MNINKLLSSLFTTAIAVIASCHLAFSQPFSEKAPLSELMKKKLEANAAIIEQLAALKDAGFSEDTIQHMKHLLLHKLELVRSGNIPASHQLLAKKVAMTSEEMAKLGQLHSPELPQQDIASIQKALLHKLGHRQDELSFAYFR